MHLEFKRAQAVGDAFDAVRLTVCKVVHGVNAPRIARSMVGRKFDAVHQRVSHVHVGVGHVNLGSEHHAAFKVLALPHLLEQGQILLHRAVTKRTRLARLRGGAFLGRNLLCRLFVDVRIARLDQLDSVTEQRLEVVGCVELATIPFKAQPRDVFSDRIYVRGVLLHRIGVVKAQVDLAIVFCRQAEVDANRFGMTDVKETVGLRRKPRVNPTVVHVGFTVRIDDLLDEMAPCRTSPLPSAPLSSPPCSMTQNYIAPSRR